jgi:hypothetical protein
MPDPLVPPILLLTITLVITLIAVIVSGILRRRQRGALLELARQWGMQYSPSDVFNLAPRIASHLPIMGASDVRVRDLIYGTDSRGGHRCVFSAEYTFGVVRSKSRRRCVACVVEVLDVAPQPSPAEAIPGAAQKVTSILQIAPWDLPLIDQYETLRPRAE